MKAMISQLLDSKWRSIKLAPEGCTDPGKSLRRKQQDFVHIEDSSIRTFSGYGSAIGYARGAHKVR